MFKNVKTYTVGGDEIKMGQDEDCDLQLTLPCLENIRMVLDMKKNQLIIEKQNEEGMVEKETCDLAPEEIFRIHTVFMYYTEIDEERVRNIANDEKLREKDEYIADIVSKKEKMTKKQLAYVDKSGKNIVLELKNCVYRKGQNESNTSMTATTEIQESAEASEEVKKTSAEAKTSKTQSNEYVEENSHIKTIEDESITEKTEETEHVEEGSEVIKKVKKEKTRKSLEKEKFENEKSIEMSKEQDVKVGGRAASARSKKDKCRKK